MNARLAALERRLDALEAITRPLRAARTAVRSSDDEVARVLASIVGVDWQRLQGDERGRNVTAARRVVAEILRSEYGWTPGRIARAMRKHLRTVQAMLGK